MTGRAILRLIRPPGRIVADRMDFRGKPLLTRSEREMREVRGAGMSMVMQDPKFSLNPVMTIGNQIGEAPAHRRALSSKETRHRVVEMLDAVRIGDPDRVSSFIRIRFPAAWASAS